MEKVLDVLSIDVLSCLMFTELLKKLGLTKREFAERLGVSPHQVSVWKEKPPRYAMAYLELLLKEVVK